MAGYEVEQMREAVAPVKLVSVYETDALEVLYQSLKERDATVNISHRELPTWEQHCAFVARQPYPVWCLVMAGKPVGNVYLTEQNEIGVFILKAHQGNGYGTAAVRELMRQHPRDRFLANINPTNERSIRMFAKLGFGHIQNTYELR